MRWILNDEVESSIHKTKKKAIKEYIRLKTINYKHLNSIELLRHNKKTDEYTLISLIKINKRG